MKSKSLWEMENLILDYVLLLCFLFSWEMLSSPNNLSAKLYTTQLNEWGFVDEYSVEICGMCYRLKDQIILNLNKCLTNNSHANYPLVEYDDAQTTIT